MWGMLARNSAGVRHGRVSHGSAHFHITCRGWLKHGSRLRTRSESRHVHLPLTIATTDYFSSMASKQTQKIQQQPQQPQQSQAQLAKQKAAEEAEKIKEYIAKQVLCSAPNHCTFRVLLILQPFLASIILIVIPMTSMNIVTSSCQSPCSK